MTASSAFIPEEWEVLSAGILQPALAVSLAERGGTLVEMLALYDTLTGELKANAGNPLIAALLNYVVSRKAADVLKAYDEIDFETLLAMALRTLASALALLRQKAQPDEVVIYGNVVRTVSQHVASAHDERDVISGSTVSASEQSVLDKVNAILNTR
ncbi:MAG: hypothetical protein UZ15_CFX003003013 [Chloroflexi bacterium OLB15]|nr:MAG: hypothetical protein UZ15_CFX003003013 [Chloroflexi bacterium OLB15]